MRNVSLLEHERAVEGSRAKLSQDLAVLCSSETLASFTEDLKQEALDTKDGILENIKARATVNPAAVIAIGAGLAWQFIRRPPIASALIGVGLFSLWKTDAKRGDPSASYLQQSQQALKEQAGEFVSAASEIAGHAQGAILEKGAQAWDGATERMRKFGEAAGESLSDAGAKLKSSGTSFLDDVRHKEHDLRGKIEVVAAVAAEKVSDEDTRNKVLLGVAGVAIAAALGIAYQKRISETMENA
jgi:hypothetical protein